MSKKIFIAQDKMFDYWITKNKNVLFEGLHGTGKTASVLDAWKRHELKFLYFSAATMDPWIDFVGVPEKITDPKTGKVYLDLVRPKQLSDDDVEAIFIDEYNRSHKKVRNAVMELIQFKSINGKKFKNLRIVWAAINPDGGPYDTETLDPAQKDRFHVFVKVPFELNHKYLAEKYDVNIAEAASEWWYGIDEELRKKHCSPRRLDYALEMFLDGGDIREFVLDPCLNVGKLLSTISKGPILGKFEELIKKGSDDEIKKFLEDPNNYNDLEHVIKEKKEYILKCIPLLPPERQRTIMASDLRVRTFMVRNPKQFREILENTRDNSTNDELKKICETALAILEKDEQIPENKEMAEIENTKKTLETTLNMTANARAIDIPETDLNKISFKDPTSFISVIQNAAPYNPDYTHISNCLNTLNTDHSKNSLFSEINKANAQTYKLADKGDAVKLLSILEIALSKMYTQSITKHSYTISESISYLTYVFNSTYPAVTMKSFYDMFPNIVSFCKTYPNNITSLIFG